MPDERRMNRPRLRNLQLTLFVIVILVVVMMVVFRLRSEPKGFAVPGDCVKAFYDATLSEDGDKAKACLSVELRKDVAKWIRNKAGLTSEVHNRDISETNETSAFVYWDEGRESGVQRIRYDLRKGNNGWLIVGISAPKKVPAVVNPGTKVSDVPEP